MKLKKHPRTGVFLFFYAYLVHCNAKLFTSVEIMEMGDNNYPTPEQRQFGPLEAARRELQRDVDAGLITKEEMRRQHRKNKRYWKGWGTPEWGKKGKRK